MIVLDSTQELASPTDQLLRESERFKRDLDQVMEGDRRVDETRDTGVKPSSRTAKPSVFVSYSSEDAPFAESLANALDQGNVGVWLDRWEVRVGDSLTKKIGHALRNNDFIVVVLSPASTRSEWVRRELAEARIREIAQKHV
jgi:TIR domain